MTNPAPLSPKEEGLELFEEILDLFGEDGVRDISKLLRYLRDHPTGASTDELLALLGPDEGSTAPRN